MVSWVSFPCGSSEWRERLTGATSRGTVERGRVEWSGADANRGPRLDSLGPPPPPLDTISTTNQHTLTPIVGAGRGHRKRPTRLSFLIVENLWPTQSAHCSPVSNKKWASTFKYRCI